MSSFLIPPSTEDVVGLTLPEKVLSTLGLNQPTGRFFAGFLVTQAFMVSLRPQVSYLDDGTPRVWRLISPTMDSTLVPWWMPGLFVGGILSLFF